MILDGYAFNYEERSNRTEKIETGTIKILAL
jgi:hypothetical protein